MFFILDIMQVTFRL